eukprot:CAMPEP_0174263494 /NCGR_PEP_ID=MMETSP0439-20130205/18917_1 /TAXON_ID=0 /ORGANISM="Stereomyxa ramosa, Strain Chinc5" /LENGTH=312 /DNA_ID=CAMNT_0015348867 /DNA_START=92 /DNA_END=1027 /DNA_ORIENTATION=+
MGQAYTTNSVISEPDPYLKDVHFMFRDKDRFLTEAWQSFFLDEDNDLGVGGLGREEAKHLIQHTTVMPTGDIFKKSKEEITDDEDDGLIHADAIVSPANSFGFMDGGIDMVYSLRFGWQMNGRLHEVIQKDFHGELLVGQAAIITTEDPKETIKYLVSAPTMRVPADVRDTANAYLAFRATLLAVSEHNRKVTTGEKEGTVIKDLLCCGLGTAIGLMPAETCAFQMFKAYVHVSLGHLFPYGSLSGYQMENDTLCKNRYGKQGIRRGSSSREARNKIKKLKDQKHELQRRVAELEAQLKGDKPTENTEEDEQ